MTVNRRVDKLEKDLNSEPTKITVIWDQTSPEGQAELEAARARGDQLIVVQWLDGDDWRGGDHGSEQTS